MFLLIHFSRMPAVLVKIVIIIYSGEKWQTGLTHLGGSSRSCGGGAGNETACMVNEMMRLNEQNGLLGPELGQGQG